MKNKVELAVSLLPALVITMLLVALFLTRQLHREYLHRSHSALTEMAMKKPVELKNSRVEQQGR